MLNCAVSLLAIVVFAFALHAIFNLKSSLTPLVSLAVLIDINIVFAMYDMLREGVWVTYIISIVALAIAIYKNKGTLTEKIDSFFSPGVILFLISSIAMLLFLSIRQPLMSEWDEFSFWGISKHLMKIHDQLYTYYPSSMIGNSTPPALGVLAYYFQWALPEFAEWVCFFGYDVMFFACYSAFTSAFDKKSWNSAFMVYLFGFLSPYIFEVYTKIIYLEPVYITTYADIPLGVMFAAAVAVYFFSGDNNSRDILPVLPVLMMLTMIKDMGFALSCIAAFVIFFDLVVRNKEFSFLKLKGFLGKCLAGFVMVAVSAGSFVSWSMHMIRVLERNPFELGGVTNMSQAQMLITGVKELLIGPRSQKFIDVTEQMYHAFFDFKICMIGSGFVLFCVITIVFIVAFILGDKTGKKRTAMLYVTSIISFVGYYVFHLFLYVYIFRDQNAYGLASYNRYIYPFYIGWICFAVFVLCLAVRDGKRFLSKTTLFGFIGVFFVLFNFYVSYDNIFIECNDRSFATRLNIKEKVEYIEDAVEPDDVIYLYCGGDNGERWFIYTHEFASNIIVEERAVDIEGLTEEERKEKYQQTFYERFKQLGVTNVMIDCSSPEFEYLFGDLFDWNVNNVGTNSIAYYEVVYEDDWYHFELIKGGVVSDD